MAERTMSYLITGRSGTGVQDRLAIDTLQTKDKQFSLFILAFLVVQERTDEVQKLLPNFTYTPSSAATYREIAGIHGLPYSRYSGDPKDTDNSHYDGQDKKDTMPSPSRFGGYCNHGSVLFPTWHRPYVLLLEQAIGEAAVAIATFIEGNYTNSGIWIDDANQLRLPSVNCVPFLIPLTDTGTFFLASRYWDWAGKDVGQDGIPDVFCTYEVQILDPTGTGSKTPIANPLSYYPFAEIPDGFNSVTHQDDAGKTETAYFANWQVTTRHAPSSPDPYPKSDIEALNADLKKSAADLRDKIARLFTFLDGSEAESPYIWDEFSNHTVESSPETKYHAGSLEGVHDSIHDIIGGNGHMGFPDYAGFDPFFFIHHTTVDRFFALWEWCYPDYWMNDGYGDPPNPWTQGRGTWYEVYNEKIDPDSALAPFRNDSDIYWTSSQARFLDPSGSPKYYSYPEVAGIKVDKPAETQEDRDKARAALQQHYGLDPDSTQAKLKAAKLDFFQSSAPAGHKGFDYRVFVVVVQLPEHAFNTSYSFRLHHQKSKDEEQLIGSVAVFARPDYSPCKGCAARRDNRNMVRGIVTIPPVVIDHIIRTSEHGLNNRAVKEEKLISGIKEALKGRLLDSAGRELGIGHVKKPLREGKRLPSHLVPSGIELHSSAVARPLDGGPVHFYDWKYHSGIFEHGWEKGRGFPKGM
ncbi:hypothetical protein D9615_008337 [Tricholomella constricta]|uniref:tyrosinase n=1 Tax=Tricholomella constricta TaxID=117010 RepID=A0A8H5HDP7_9AGAR|nr:hypothetical protein D9615_008337 [Tricholomella constricta]